MTDCASSMFLKILLMCHTGLEQRESEYRMKEFSFLEETVPLRTDRENKHLAKMFMLFCHICNLNRFEANSLDIPMKDRSLVILF